MKILGISSAETLIWCGAVAAALASVFAFYSKNVVGKIVRALLKANALDADSAKTLKQLDCDSTLCRFALRSGSMEQGAVLSASDGSYYISKDKAEKMQAKYCKSEASALTLVVVLAIVAVAAALLAAAYPTVARLLGIA
ncbi:MAG: hypothetical protein IJB65_05265 [Clostridia bacterium]|nr:hypothetical protein [Clostridia bacterium]